MKKSYAIRICLKKVFVASAILLTGVFMSMKANASESVYSFDVIDIDGKKVSLDQFSGKTLLIVNTASGCGFTPQYESLQKLYDIYRDKGFEVLAFPSNDFGGQEPGTNEEIKKFCDLRFKIKFKLFSKISVKGKEIEPLYEYLTERMIIRALLSGILQSF